MTKMEGENVWMGHRDVQFHQSHGKRVLNELLHWQLERMRVQSLHHMIGALIVQLASTLPGEQTGFLSVHQLDQNLTWS